MLDYSDMWKGCVAFMLSMQYFMLEHIVPVLNTAAALAGAFIAFHGVYRIIKNWRYERRIRNARLPDEKIY